MDSKFNESKQFEEAILTELLAIVTHPCQSLSYMSFEFWKDFWKEKSSLFQNDEDGNPVIPELPATIVESLRMMAQTILSSFPRQIVKCDLNNEYITFAFDSSVEYEETFYPKFKTELLEILRLITVSFESLVMDFTIQLFTSLQNESIAQIQLHHQQVDQDAKYNFSNWDILAIILDSVCVKLANPGKFLHQIQPCLESLLTESSEIMALPLLLSHQLSCISALAPFLPHLPSIFTERIANRMLLLACYKLDETNNPNNRNSMEIIHLHGHACNAFVKFSRRVSSLLVPMFSRLRDQIYSGSYSQLKVEVLTEGLIVISNQFKNELDQKAFIIYLMENITWLATFNMDTVAFFDFLGITQPPNALEQIFANVPSNTTSDAINCSQVNNSSASSEVRIFHENRTTILFNVNMALALIKRVQNKSILLPEIIPFLKATLMMINHLNAMWVPEFRSAGYIKCPELLAKLYAPANDAEKAVLLEYQSIQNSDGKKLSSPYSRLQSFLWSLHESLCSFVGVCCASLSPTIYTETNLMVSVLSTSNHLPKMKIKMILKQFVRPFLVNFPLESNVCSLDNINGVLTQFLPWVYSQIDERWKALRMANAGSVIQTKGKLAFLTSSNTSVINSIDSMSLATSAAPSPLISRSRGGLLFPGSTINGKDHSTSGDGDTSTTTQLEAELIDDQSNRVLSREFVELLMACLFSPPNTRRNQQQSNANDVFTDMDMDTETNDAVGNSDSTKGTDILSDLGSKLTSIHRPLFIPIVAGMLLWLDSVVVCKACLIMRHLVKELVDQKLITSKSDVSFLLEHLFTALKDADIDADGIVSIVILLISMLFEGVCSMQQKNSTSEIFSLKEPFWQISNTNQRDWEAFESKYIKPALKGNVKINEKKKKDALKSLLSNIIGSNCL